MSRTWSLSLIVRTGDFSAPPRMEVIGVGQPGPMRSRATWPVPVPMRPSRALVPAVPIRACPPERGDRGPLRPHWSAGCILRTRKCRWSTADPMKCRGRRTRKIGLRDGPKGRRHLQAGESENATNPAEMFADRPQNSENSKANRIETMKGPAESGQICSVGRRKIAKKIAKNKRCYANTLRPAQGCC